MRFAMHQPNYAPWLGYFHKMAHADVFVILDAVQYPRGRSFAARNRIRSVDGVRWLTIPVSLPRGMERKVPYAAVKLSDPDAPRAHLRMLDECYRGAPFRSEMLELYARSATGRRFDGLVDLNMALIGEIASYLGISTTIVRLSELLPTFGHRSDLIVEIAAALGADTYLSGDGGGREYTDEQHLAQHGVRLEFQGFEHPTYPQAGHDEFAPGLSALDAIANCGHRTDGLVEQARQHEPL
jgi:WbqC-like protein family